MARRTGARDVARARKRAQAMLKRAERQLDRAEAAKTCATRTKAALEALESATFASCEASGYRTSRLPRALTLQAEARRIIARCTKKR